MSAIKIVFGSNTGATRKIRIIRKSDLYILDNNDHSFKEAPTWANSLISATEQFSISYTLFSAEAIFPAGIHSCIVLIYNGTPIATDSPLYSFIFVADGDNSIEVTLKSIAGQIEALEGGESSPSVILAAKTIINKAIQNKTTGAVVYYDDDGITPVLTQTPTDGLTTITRQPS